MNYKREKRWANKYSLCVRCKKRDQARGTLHCDKCLDYFKAGHVTKSSRPFMCRFLASSYR